MKTTTIQVGPELFVAHDFPSGPGKVHTLRPPGNVVSRAVRRLQGQAWQPEDARSAYTGPVQGFPRTRLWRRYFTGPSPMWEREPVGAPGDLIDYVGPMRSRVRLYPEREQATFPPNRYGPREPIGDSLNTAGTGYNPIVDAPGGRWISPYQGLESAPTWWWHHVRSMDRCSTAISDPPLSAMLDANGLTKTCRWDTQARMNPSLSLRPDGLRSSHPWYGDPMDQWLGPCGNAGYNGAHLIRQYRSAMALAWLFADRTLHRIASEDILGIAREVTYTLSPYKAKPGWEGDTTAPPYNYPGSYMNRTPLAYKAKAPVGPDGGRTMGWYAHVLSCAMALGHTAEMKPTAHALLEWTRASLLPSGFIQSVRYDQTGGPQPKDCGVRMHELSAAEIETPIFAASVTGLCLQTYGIIPNWCVEMLDRLCGIYLRFWQHGTPPAWSKYFVHGEVDGTWYRPEQVFMSPEGPRSTTNAWWLFEAGLRFGSGPTQKAIAARKVECENLWNTRADIRPWAAGLMGSLNA